MTPQLQKEFDKAIADFPYVIKEASDVSVAKIGGDQGYCSDYIYLPTEGVIVCVSTPDEMNKGIEQGGDGIPTPSTTT